MESRINNPRKVSSGVVDSILARGVLPTIQFSEPRYTEKLLKQINTLCLKYGSDLEVRFYGHYSTTFDASIVDMLPDVQWLSVESLQRITNPEALCDLANLRKLAFGVVDFDQTDFLSKLQISKLRWLALSDNDYRNLDLAPLAVCRELEQLYLNGHTNNINALSDLPSLRELSLRSIAKRCTLEFVESIPQLQSLQIILGGRASFDELSHPTLERLSVIRVRGLETLGDLKRFPRLRSLRVEDQSRLSSFSVAGTEITEISVHNCKNLENIAGMLDLEGLKEFRVSRTKLPLDDLLAAKWPPSLDAVALYSSSQQWNEEARKALNERGFRESNHS